jgi:hypothetical protein
MTFTLLWWHAPVALTALGVVMFVMGQRARNNVWDWPDSETPETGIFGAVLTVLSLVVLFGGWYRGLFI